MRPAVAMVGLVLLSLGTPGVADEYKESELRAIGEGRGLYLVSCASCHGELAKGVAENPHPGMAPDLTLIVLRDGTFDRIHVGNHIRFGDPTWNDRQGEDVRMPAWGRLLRTRNFGSEGKAAVDMFKLVRYLEFVQATE